MEPPATLICVSCRRPKLRDECVSDKKAKNGKRNLCKRCAAGRQRRSKRLYVQNNSQRLKGEITQIRMDVATKMLEDPDVFRAAVNANRDLYKRLLAIELDWYKELREQRFRAAQMGAQAKKVNDAKRQTA